MIRRLAEVSYDEGFASPTPQQIDFWLRELRTPEVLIECARAFPQEARRAAASRPAIGAAIRGDQDAVGDALAVEEATERERDRTYWTPLKAELEALRHSRNRGS